MAAIPACTTVSTPSKLNVTLPATNSPIPIVVDRRTEEQKAYRENVSELAIWKYFADDTLQPSIADLVRHRIADAVTATRRDAHIELLRADIGYWIYMSGPSPSAYAPVGVPAVPMILGNLIGMAGVYGFKRAIGEESGVAFIEIAVDGKRLLATEIVPVKDRNAEAAVRLALSRALGNLSDRIMALDGGPHATPPPAPAN